MPLDGEDFAAVLGALKNCVSAYPLSQILADIAPMSGPAAHIFYPDYEVFKVVGKEPGTENQHEIVKGAYFKHYKTKDLYRFVHACRIEEDCAHAVAYQSVANGTIWVRPASSFFEILTLERPDGTRFKMPRFERQIYTSCGVARYIR